MIKVILKVGFFTIFLSSIALNLSYAQQTFYGSAPASGAPTNTPSKTRVMSAEEFKSAVSKRSQQVKSSLTQQADQILKAPSTPGATTTPPPPPGMPSSPAVTGTTPSSLPPMQTPTTPTTSAPAPVKQDVYTGFGPANTEQPKPATKPAPSGSSGGWNIKY